MAKVIEETKVLTNKVLFSYANLLEPRAQNEGAEPVYSACLIIPKSDTETIEAIKTAIKNAVDNNVARLGGKKTGLHNPLRDGDVDREGNELYKNCYFINAKSKYKPQVFDRTGKNHLDSPEDVYSGMYGRAYLNFFVYAQSGNRGVSCGLGNVQKMEDGQRLGGSSGGTFDSIDGMESVENSDLPF